MVSEGSMQVFQGMNQLTVTSSYDAGEPYQWLAWHVNPKSTEMACIVWQQPRKLELRTTQQEGNNS